MTTYYQEMRNDEVTFKVFFGVNDYADMFRSLGLDVENSLTPAERSSHWTTYKDALIHQILEKYHFDDDEFVYFVINDSVYNNQNTFHVRPSFHHTFFCNCFIRSFVSNYMYEEIPPACEAPYISSKELYCYEIM